MPIIRIILFAAVLLTLINSSLANAEPAIAASTTNVTRTSTSTINGQIVESEYPSIVDNAFAKEAKTKSRQSQKRSTLNINHGLWIYDLAIDLTVDNDADGHYSTFSVTLDIDNSFSPRDVYAVFYLSQNYGHWLDYGPWLEYRPWLEYAVTDDFRVSGNSASDSVSVETSLETGYPSDYYDLYAEVYDAYSGDLLLTYGPDQSGHVTGIPFESIYDDTYYAPLSVQLTYSGSGSTSWFTLLFFAMVLTCRAIITRQAETTTRS